MLKNLTQILGDADDDDDEEVDPAKLQQMMKDIGLDIPFESKQETNPKP